MVKPAGTLYLDVIRQVRDAVRVPVVAYQVSGEYSLIKAAAARGWIDERAACSRPSPASAAPALIWSSPTSRRKWRGAAQRRDGGRFLAACRRRQPVPHRPVWVMRQAGRYLPEYRAVRAKVDFETLTRTPELAAEVTLQPLRRFELDAAILFSDIMTPLQGMGVALDFAPGPHVREPIRTDAQIDALPALVPERDVPFVLDTIRLVRANVPRGAPLIGFAGAPFTLLCYLVCGKPSKEFGPARSFLYAQPDTAERLLEQLADAMGQYLARRRRPARRR